jgi:hypothetical protein
MAEIDYLGCRLGRITRRWAQCLTSRPASTLRSAATRVGCGRAATGNGAFPGRVISAARKPTLCAPMVLSPGFRTLLEFAEACDVPTRYACRSGVWHPCVTPVIEGDTDFREPPLEAPAAGSVLLWTATPRTDLVPDL